MTASHKSATEFLWCALAMIDVHHEMGFQKKILTLVNIEAVTGEYGPIKFARSTAGTRCQLFVAF
jgi:hypothetical protein